MWTLPRAYSLIVGYSLNKNLVKNRSYKIYFENEVKVLEEKKEEDAKILKFTEYR